MRPTRSVTILWVASLGVLACGLIVLLLYASSEMLANPGISLVDAFEIGRLPWTPIGVGLVLGGATATLVFGSAMVLTGGTWLLRALSIPGLAAGALWWIDTLVLGGPVSECAPPCIGGPERSDIITIAYSSPQYVIEFVLIPALLASILAYVAMRRRRESHEPSMLPQTGPL